MSTRVFVVKQNVRYFIGFKVVNLNTKDGALHPSCLCSSSTQTSILVLQAVRE